jgi:Fibronectin type III domain
MRLFPLPLSVPSSPPENPKCDVLGSTSIYVTWSPPHKDGQNGKIRGYKVAYSAADEYHERSPMMATTTNQYFTIDNARKYTNYTITVLAFTSIGDGVKTKNFHCITHEDGELELLRVQVRSSLKLFLEFPFFFCLSTEKTAKVTEKVFKNVGGVFN